MRIKELRRKKKISQLELGEAIGFSQRSVASWENGTREPGVDALIRMADVFNVSLDYLMGRIPEAKRADVDILLTTYNELTQAGQQEVIHYSKFILASEVSAD